MGLIVTHSDFFFRENFSKFFKNFQKISNFVFFITFYLYYESVSNFDMLRNFTQIFEKREKKGKKREEKGEKGKKRKKLKSSYLLNLMYDFAQTQLDRFVLTRGFQKWPQNREISFSLKVMVKKLTSRASEASERRYISN